jgi:hypothetical protein
MSGAYMTVVDEEDGPTEDCYPAQWSRYVLRNGVPNFEEYYFGEVNCENFDYNGYCNFGVTDLVVDALNEIKAAIPSEITWLKYGIGRAWQNNGKKGKNTISIENWAYTYNYVHYNQSNPAQTLNAIKFSFTTDSSVSYKDIKSIEISINDKSFTVKNGDTLGVDELKQFFDFGDLPTPELKVRKCDEENPEVKEFEYQINNNPDSTAFLYPWSDYGANKELLIKITNIIYESNSYKNSLPEELK